MSAIDFVPSLLFSLKGRIGRSRFWIGTLVLASVSFAATYLILAAVGISDRAVLLSMLVAFALAYPSYAVMAKRSGPRQAGLDGADRHRPRLRHQPVADVPRDRPSRANPALSCAQPCSDRHLAVDLA
jgi:hypothetical protein